MTYLISCAGLLGVLAAYWAIGCYLAWRDGEEVRWPTPREVVIASVAVLVVTGALYAWSAHQGPQGCGYYEDDPTYSDPAGQTWHATACPDDGSGQ